MKQAICDTEIHKIIHLYRDKCFTISKIAKNYKVSTDAVVFIMRKHGVKRRTNKEAQRLKFMQSTKSFTRKKLDSNHLQELAIAASMLYWAEGYKGSLERPAKFVDFANSDPFMIRVFLNFLRSVYVLDESRLRVYLYCHDNNDVSKLITYWQNVTKIPAKQFSKPYIKQSCSHKHKRMQYGLIHIRYHDKKLLLDIKNMIDYYMHRYAPIV